MYSALKRSISFLMAVIMVFSMLPVSAFATEDIPVVQEEAVQETISAPETSAPETEPPEESSEPKVSDPEVSEPEEMDPLESEPEESEPEETDPLESEPEETDPLESEPEEFEPEETEPEVSEPEEPTLVALEILSLPDRIQYQVGDEIDLTGLNLTARMSDGESFTVTPDDGITLESGDTTMSGRETVVVSFDGLTAEFEIQIHTVFQTDDILQDKSGYPESSHNYSNSTNKTYTYTVEGALSLKLVFSSSTFVENNYDYIYLYDGSGNQLGKYTGSTLASQTVTVPGDTVKIKLTSDGSVTKYGFSLTAIYASMLLMEHEPTDEGIYTEPGCFTDGYTDHVCWICDEPYVEADPGSARHTFLEGFCENCGLPENAVQTGQISDTIAWGLTEDNVLYISGSGVIPKGQTWNLPSGTSLVIREGITGIAEQAFYNCSNLSSVQLPSTVTAIGDYAFYYCTGITSVTFAEGLKSIGSYAFYSCSALTEAVLPESVQTIGQYCFGFCYEMQTIRIPDNVTALSNNIFYACAALTEVTLSQNLTEIGNYAFYNCQRLPSIDLPDSLTTIGQYAFSGCNSLTQILLPDSLQSLGTNCFENCFTLTEIEIPAGITAIPDYAFSSCGQLAEIRLPAGLKSIGNYAFRSCSSLTSITLPQGLTTLGSYCFYSCYDITELYLPASVTTFRNSGNYGPLNGSSITKVTFADGYTSIPNYALSGATNLREVVFEAPEKIKSIGSYAFANCSSLEAFEIPADVSSLGDYVFYYCTALNEIRIPAAITRIPYNAFYYCTSLQSVDLPETLTQISNYAFYYCYSLSEISIPETVTQIGTYAFYTCSGLQNVTIPDNTTLSSYAFAYCAGLQNLTIGDKVTLAGYSFRDCSNLNSISLGQNCTIDANAFYNVYITGSCGDEITYSLDISRGILTLSGSGEMYDYTADEPSPWSDFNFFITEIQMPDAITHIGAYAFADMPKLDFLVLPEKLESFGENAFAGCPALTYLEIPEYVSFIGESAFADCDNLAEAVFTGDAPTMEDNIFGTTTVQVFYPETGSGYIGRIFDKFLDYIWNKWDNTVPTKDVVLLLDVSGSMSGKTSTLSSAATQLIRAIGGATRKTRISIVTYESTATTVTGFSTNNSYLAKKISSLNANGGTHYYNALSRARNLLNGRNADIPFVIMFSDGQPGDTVSTINSTAQAMRDSGIMIYTVGLGTNSSQRQVLVNVAGSESRYFEASNIAGLVAAFEELSRNFGKNEYSSIEMKINDKRVDLFKETYTICLAANDTISFFATAGTNEKYDNVAEYALEQNGRYLVRNTTGEFTNLSAASVFSAGSPVYLVLLDASGNVIERKELNLEFVNSYTLRYLMGPDMGNTLYKETTYIPGTTITPPAVPKRIGFVFDGWYPSENCEGLDFFTALSYTGSQKLTGNITLYPKWKSQDTELDLGVDTWTFSNSNSNFSCTHHEMTANDVSRLLQGLNSSEQARMNSWRFPTKYDSNGNIVHYWGGSCFGMSSSVLLDYFGDLNIYDFPANGTGGTRYSTIGAASLTANTNGDNDVGAIESMINFYQLRQGLGSINAIRTNYVAHTDGTDSSNLSRIIQKLKTENAPILMTITLIKPNNSYGGHAVVAYDLEEFADHYCFKVYDCSQFGTKNNPIYYTVTVQENNGTYTASCPEWTQAWTNSGYNRIFFKTALTTGELRALPLLIAPNTLNRTSSISQDNNFYILTTNYGNFTITDGSNSAVIINGERSSGTLDILCLGQTNDISAEPEYTFQLPVLAEGRSYTIVQNSASYCRTNLFYSDAEDGFYTSQLAPASGTVIFGSDGSIRTSYAGTVEQHVEITHNSMTTPWYTVNVTGDSTGLTLTPGDDSVTVLSEEETTVDITTNSAFNSITLNNIPVGSEESAIQESEDSCVIVQNGQIVAGEVYGYSVVFNSQMGTSVPTLTNVPYGSLISEPTDPIKTGCIFEGWFKDEAYTELWDFGTDTVTQDTVLYAGWSVNPNYLKSVTFRVPGMEDQIVYIPKGDLIPAEYAPVDENGQALNWYTRSDFANDPWNFDEDVVSSDLVLYGKTNLCTVILDPGNGSALINLSVYSGNRIPEPENVVREGYTLCGWYTNGSYTKQWDFTSDRVSGHVTLYAKWVENVIDKEGRDTGISVEVVKPTGVVYTGKAVIPTVIVRDNGKVLTANVDYTVSFKNNTAACYMDDASVPAAKRPQILIQGKGDYKSAGKITRYFTIHPADIASLNITIPDAVTVKSGSKLQTLKTVVKTDLVTVNVKEYSVLYFTDSNLDEAVDGITGPGTYYVILVSNGINLMGNSEIFRVHAAAAEKMLAKAKITPAKPITSTAAATAEDDAIRAIISKLVLGKVTWTTEDENLAAFKELFTVTAVDTDGTAVSQADLGRLLNSVGKKTVTVTAIEGNAEGLVGSVSAAITVTGTPLNKKQFAVTFGAAGAKEILKTGYTGATQVPSIYTDLVEGEDYTLTFLSGKTAVSAGEIRNAGSYTMTITGKGKWSGSLSYKFTIDPMNLATAYTDGLISIVSAGNAVYSPNGASLKPTISLIGSRQLAEGTDYTLKFSGNTAVTDKAAITVTGKGNFKGSLAKIPELTYSIEAKSIASADISVAVTGMTLKNNAVTKISYTVSDSGKKIPANQFTGSFTDNGDTVTLTVTAAGKNYTGTRIMELSKTLISAADKKQVTVSLVEGSKYYYTGSPIHPEVRIEDAEGYDISDCFTVTYGTNKYVGSGTVTVTGRPDMGYCNSVTVKFTILPKWMMWLFG